MSVLAPWNQNFQKFKKLCFRFSCNFTSQNVLKFAYFTMTLLHHAEKKRQYFETFFCIFQGYGRHIICYLHSNPRSLFLVVCISMGRVTML